jgi:hypothetical protein
LDEEQAEGSGAQPSWLMVFVKRSLFAGTRGRGGPPSGPWRHGHAAEDRKEGGPARPPPISSGPVADHARKDAGLGKTLVKIGADHRRYVLFQMAETAVPDELFPFRGILKSIEAPGRPFGGFQYIIFMFYFFPLEEAKRIYLTQRTITVTRPIKKGRSW